MEAMLTPEERLRLQVQISKARRLKAEEARRQAQAERKAKLATGARFVAMFADGREGEQYVSRYGGQPIWDRDRAAVHADRQCQAIKQMQNAEVRQATPEEVANMGPVGTGPVGSPGERTSVTPGPSLGRSRGATRCGRCPAARSRAIAGGTRDTTFRRASPEPVLVLWRRFNPACRKGAMSRNIFLLDRRPGSEDQLTEMLVWLISAVPDVGRAIVRLAFGDIDLDLGELEATTQHRISGGRLDALLRSESLVLVVESKLGSVYGVGQLRAYVDWLATGRKDVAHKALMTLTASEAPWPAGDLARAVQLDVGREPASVARAIHRALVSDGDA